MTVEFTKGETIEPCFEFIGFRKEITPHLECSELNITLPTWDFENLVQAICCTGIREGIVENGVITIPNVLMKVKCEFPKLKR